jgi:hypothetical protein
MKTNVMTIVCCILTAAVAYAQCPIDDLEDIISATTVKSHVTGTHYMQKLDVSVAEFYALAEVRKKLGHQEDGDFDKWKKRNGKNAKYYMFYTNAEGKVYLYYEDLDEELAKQFQQYLPKGTYTFDENTYNTYFRDIDFSKSHWKEGGDVHARLADMRRLAVAAGKDLGITIDPAKITFRLFETQKIEGLPPTRMYIPTTTKRNDGVGGFAKWDDAVTSIEIDADNLQKGSVSDAIRTMLEEVYHKYQMAEVKKGQTEKSQIWLKSFREENENNYVQKVIDAQKQLNTEKNTAKRDALQGQKDAALHSYFKLAHEQDAKEDAGKKAAIEYAIRKNLFK